MRFFTTQREDTAPHDEATQDMALRALLHEAVPTDELSPQLRDRIAQMAAQADARIAAAAPVMPSAAAPPPPTRRERTLARRATKREQRGAKRLVWQTRFAHPRVRWGLSAAAIAIFFVGLSVAWPRLLSSQALARVEAAMAKVSSVHTVRWRIENGKRIKEGEDWYQGGLRREEEPENQRIHIYREGRAWNYDKVSHQATVRRMEKQAELDPSHFTLSGLVSNMRQHSDKIEVKLLGQTTLEGRTVNRVQLETTTSYEFTTLLLLVDPATDLPLRADMHVRTVYGKEADWQIDLAYNDPLSASLFETKFVGARVVDLDRGAADWKARLAKPLVEKKVGERTFAIRDLQVNERGDVFLLSTEGKTLQDQFWDGENRLAGRDWKVFLSDDLGTRYHWAGDLEFKPNSTMIAGQRLETDWWIPDVANDRQHPWRARTFTLKFIANPRNLHGPAPRDPNKPGFTADYSVRFSLPLRVDAPASTVVPTYNEPLSLGISEESILRREAQERGELLPGQVPSPQLWRTLSDGSNGKEWSFLFSPDGRFVVSGSAKGVILRDVQTGRVMHTFALETAAGGPVAFTPDSRSLLATYGRASADDPSMSKGAQMRVWDVASGKVKAAWVMPPIPKGHSVQTRNIASDGKTLQETRTVVTQWGQPWGKKGERTVETQSVLVQQLDLFTGRVLAKHILPHQGFVRDTAEAGTQMVTSQDRRSGKRKIGGVVRLWNAQSGQLERTLHGTEEFDTGAIAFSQDASQVAVNVEEVDSSGTLDGRHREIHLYDASTGEQRLSLQPVGSFVSALTFSPDGTLLASDGEDNVIQIWDTSSGALRQTLIGHGSTVIRLAFSPNGSLLMSTDTRDKTLLWKLK